MKIFQKFIAIIIITSLLLSSVFTLFFIKPKQAQALDGGGSWANTIKEMVLDAVAWTISDVILKRLEAKIIAWGQGKTSDEIKPFAISDWVKYFKEALNLASAKFVNELELTPLCYPINIAFGERLGLTRYYIDEPIYRVYGACTIGDVVENVEDFFEHPSITMYGWDTWTALTQPQNNIYGAWFLAMEEKERIEAEEDRAADKKTAVSGGYRNETVTTGTDAEACQEACKDKAYGCVEGCGGDADCETDCNNEFATCQQGCEMKPGTAIQEKIKTLGGKINTQVSNILGKDLQRIISADEITKLIGIFFSALLNRAVHGLGLDAIMTGATVTNVERARAEQKERYSYQQAYKKEQTIEETKDVRSTLLSEILKSIQQLARSIISCEEKEMMTIDDFAKNLSDIMSANVEALYVGMEGVNLKPDFEVLDPRFAPYNVYGYSWGHVPAIKFPEKCKKVLEQLKEQFPSLNIDPYNATCRDIRSGLEPNYNAQCETCMYDHDALSCPPAPIPPQPYPQAGQGEPWTEAIIRQKEDFYNACRGWYIEALNRCSECLKKVDEKCGQVDREQREQCIQDNCSNYGDIVTHITGTIADGLDYYNKCLMEEKKDACYTCLKEYFMPATYCEQTKDYVARSLAKYPALVKMTKSASLWWFAGGIIGGIIGAITGDDKGMFIGPYDETVAKMGGECDDNYAKQDISVSLICRIMPEFTYGGEKICRTRCSQRGMTEEELRDISDFRPHDLDCGRSKVNIGGREPFNTINGGLLRTRAKCCADAWQHDRNNYAICTGSGETGAGEPPAGPCTYAVPMDQEPWCYCYEGERPIARVHNGRPAFKCQEGALASVCDPQDGCGNACSSINFTVPDMRRLNEAEISSNAAPGGSYMYIAEDSCTDPDFSSCRLSPPSGLITKSLAINIEQFAEEFSIDKLAKIFNPILPYAYAQVSNCDCATGVFVPCLANEYCDDGASAVGECNEFDFIPGVPLTGLCKTSAPPPPPPPATCDFTNCPEERQCNIISGGSGDSPGTTGYYDPPFWGGCGTCPAASKTPPGFCVALAYCDGCCFDNDWNNMQCVDAPTGPCDYVGNSPSRLIAGRGENNLCLKQTQYSTNAEGCCKAPGPDIIGDQRIVCDLSGYAGRELNLGIFNNASTDCQTGVHLCVPCDPSDSGYPNYGTNYNQCTGKI